MTIQRVNEVHPNKNADEYCQEKPFHAHQQTLIFGWWSKAILLWSLTNPIIVDGRNLPSHEEMRKLDLTYLSIDRPSVS
jgi:hypothetical protein